MRETWHRLHRAGGARLVVLGRGLATIEALANDLHQVEVGVLQEDPLALEVVIDDLLLLADDLRAARYFLQEDLHHVHLADRETLHFRLRLVYFVLVLGCLEIPQFVHDGVCGIGGLPACQDFAHLSRIKGQHRVLGEAEALVDLARCDL